MLNHIMTTPSSSTTTSTSASSSSSSFIRTSSCCISSIIRRILCFNHLTSLDRCLMSEESSSADVAGNKNNPPSIVAKLMGLESLPSTDRFEQKIPCLDSGRRLRSAKNRQIIPIIYEEFEDENFFILSFDKGCDYQTRRRRRRKARRRIIKNVRGEGLHAMDKESRGTKLTAYDYKEDFKRKIGIEDESENLSPNSILDDVLLADDEESSDCSSVNISRSRNSKIRTLSEEIQDTYSRSKEENDAIHFSSEKDEEERRHHSKWGEIGKLASDDMVKSTWIKDETSHFIRETICRELSSDILDELIGEEVARHFI